jgi:hypothetical protein
LEFDNFWQSDPNIGTHRVCGRENIHEMPPKKRNGKELPTEDSSQVVGAQVLETTTQPQTTTEPYLAMTETRRPEEPPQQTTAQEEV